MVPVSLSVCPVARPPANVTARSHDGTGDVGGEADVMWQTIPILADWCLVGNMGMDPEGPTGVVHSLTPYLARVCLVRTAFFLPRQICRGRWTRHVGSSVKLG